MTENAAAISERDERLNEVVLAYLEAIDEGMAPDPKEVLARHPEFNLELAEFFASEDWWKPRLAAPSGGLAFFETDPSDSGLQVVAGFGPGARDIHNLPVIPNILPLNARVDFFTDGQFLSGAQIGSRYRIVSLAGQGGMGVVYRADDLRLGGLPVALKFLPRAVAEGSRRFHLFLNEVRLSRQIAHPNVCRVYDVGELDGQHFLTMEYIDGEDLKSLLRRIGHLPMKKGIEIAQQLCAGLAAAHDLGVVHRDLKPANIMIDGRGQVRITDFGLACLDDGPSGVSEIAGTLAYMAPEQLAHGETTIQSDLYSLGLLLYEMFTGKPVHKGGSIASTATAPRSRTDSVVHLDPAIERTILHCLNIDPGQRPRSARDVAAELAAIETPSPDALPRQPQQTSKPSLAVLPFVNMSADQENEYLSDGITEDLIAALSRLKDLRVPARTSSFAFKGRNEDIRTIGPLLNVETVLVGSVRKSGKRLRVTAQLVKVRDGFLLWSERYDREMKDVFEIQDDITRAIVSALEVQLGGHVDKQLVKTQTMSTEAYELCAKGRGHWTRRGLGLRKALHYFELALLEDPNYALAWSGLADAYFLLGFYDFLPFRDALAKAKPAAEKAVSLDDHSAEAQCSFGVVLASHGDLHGAERHFQKALDLNSTYTPAGYWYGCVLMALGREQESIAQIQRAVEGDPLSVTASALLGWTYLSLQKFAEALLALRRSVELDPDFALGRWLLGRVYWMHGNTESALMEFHRAVELSGRSPMFLSTLGWALALSGQVDQARQIQSELTGRTVPVPTRPLYLANLHVALGEIDSAFSTLEQALAQRDFFPTWLPARCYIELLSLESDPRWTDFLEKVKTFQASSKAANNSPA